MVLQHENMAYKLQKQSLRGVLQNQPFCTLIKINEKYKFKNPVFVKLQACKMQLHLQFNSLHTFYKDLTHWWQKCHTRNIVLEISIQKAIALYLVLRLHMLKKKKLYKQCFGTFCDSQKSNDQPQCPKSPFAQRNFNLQFYSDKKRM